MIYLRNALGILLRQLLAALGFWLAARGLTLTQEQESALFEILMGAIMALVGFFWAMFAKRRDQVNPDPAKKPGGSNLNSTLYCLIPMLILLAPGCSVDRAADAERVLGKIAAATTQPEFREASKIHPLVAAAVTAVGSAATAGAIFFAIFSGKKREPK